MTCTGQGKKSGIWDVVSIILLGLTPLFLLAIIGVAVVVLIMLIQFLVDPVRFFLVQQLSFAIVMLARAQEINRAQHVGLLEVAHGEGSRG